MPALDQTPKQELVVEHFDAPLRFMVKSRSVGGATYLVDLGSEKYPHGECHCKHFVTTVGPAQLRGEARKCYHILRAEWALLKWIIPVLRAQDKNTTHPDNP